MTGILAKWVIIGRYKPGRYPLWGSMYLRWWLVEQVTNLINTFDSRPFSYLTGSY